MLLFVEPTVVDEPRIISIVQNQKVQKIGKYFRVYLLYASLERSECPPFKVGGEAPLNLRQNKPILSRFPLRYRLYLRLLASQK